MGSETIRRIWIAARHSTPERLSLSGSRTLLAAMILLAGGAAAVAQANLPEAPVPQAEIVAAEEAGGGAGFGAGAGQETFPPAPKREPGLTVPGLQPTYTPVPRPCRVNSCSAVGAQLSCCQPGQHRFEAYLRQNDLHIYTPRELGSLAFHGVADPFNLLTIAYTSALSVATDSHSPYGPGVEGFAKLSGVTVTQDMTGEFFGTFLIPSIDHQDPHYHRLPNVSIKRRIAHCIYQVFWTEGDTGQRLLNWSTILGVPAEEAISTAYVPYRQVGWGPSADRVATDWATAPIGNFVTEFVPDVARRINLHIVFVQRIIDRVAIEEGGGPAGP